jgi:iron complex outermembrane receptor protein
MKKLTSGISIFAVAVAVAAAIGAAQAARAADAGDQNDLQEIIVTGTSKSVSQSIDVKRDLDVVSDTISADDVGQFPDINLAESLQRITGVQITRLSADGQTANEGQYVSVRGLPTEFNYVGLNGEGVASASNSLVNQTADRNFNFSLLSPDFISSLEVYKSPSADMTEGGVAATINVKTVMPLDVGKELFKASIEGQSTTGEGNPTPNLSALYSDVFDEGRFGATIGYAFNKRNYLNTTVTDAQLDPETIDGTKYQALDSLGITQTQNTYVTKTGYGALQYRPIDNLTFSLIALHSVTDNNEIQPAFTIRPQYATSFSDITPDANGVLTRQIGNDSYYEAQNFLTWNVDTLDTLTLKEESHFGNWQIDSALDYSDSKSTSSQIGIDTLESGAFKVGPPYSGGYQIIPGDPIASFVLDPAFNPANPNNYFFNYVGGNILARDDIIRSAKLDATYHFDDAFIRALKAGVRFQNEVNTNASVFEEDRSQGHGSVAPYVTGSLLSTPSLNGYGGSAFVPTNYVYVNPQTYLTKFFGGSYADWLKAATTKPSLNPSNQYSVEENDTAAYLMTDYKFTWQVPIHGNFGVRVVRTQQYVTDNAVNLNDITIISPPPPPPAPSVIVPPGTTYTVSRSYYDVLPSFNLTADLMHDLLLRFAVAKVMSRPTIDDLVPRYSVTAGSSDSVIGGNPNLDPFRAWQYDLSLEYYFAPGSLASAAAFYKKVSSFIQTQHQPLVLQGVTFDEQVPVNTTGGYVGGIETSYTQLMSFLPSFWSGFGVQLNATWAQGTEDADPAADIAAHAFQNLSKWTGNASAFYDLHGVDVRLAYNYRSRYLFDPNVRGLGTTASYGEEFYTLDAQASYAITRNFTVFFEGSNLLAKSEIFSMSETKGGIGGVSYPQTWISGDRRIGAGVRLAF